MTPLTDRAYWDQIWSSNEAPTIDPRHDPHQARLDRIFARHLRPGARFLEVGAGNSAWPAHVAKHYGAEAWGIDFSRPGLDSAQRAAERAGVQVHFVEGDLMDGNVLAPRRFDVVYSGGLVEHFEDPGPLMRRLGELVAERGLLITTVPNLRGLPGSLQRWADPDCFARHVVFTPETLDRAHALGSFYPIEPTHYTGALDLGSLNLGRRMDSLPRLARALAWRSFAGGRRLAEGMLRATRSQGAGALLSSAIIGIYRLADRS